MKLDVESGKLSIKLVELGKKFMKLSDMWSETHWWTRGIYPQASETLWNLPMNPRKYSDQIIVKLGDNSMKLAYDSVKNR